MLLGFFASSTLLGRLRDAERTARTAGIIAKGGRRDAWQVLANGGVFAVAAVAHALHPDVAFLAVGAGALAASTADTWATEIGTLSRGAPRLVTTLTPVPPGTSGGVTKAGTTASVAGAGLIALIVGAGYWQSSIVFATIVAGVTGSAIDSLLGATVQARRWCDQCNSTTEQVTHRCGSPTRVTGGLGWIDNDVVNLLAGLGGAATSLLMLFFQGPLDQ
jgi:uncharacterized protein (TIGR00297 family)